MANRLVMRGYPVALPGGVQQFRPGDVIPDTDPNFATIIAAAPSPAGLATFPLAGALSAAATQAINDRLRAVPDDVVQTNLLAAAIP